MRQRENKNEEEAPGMLKYRPGKQIGRRKKSAQKKTPRAGDSQCVSHSEIRREIPPGPNPVRLPKSIAAARRQIGESQKTSSGRKDCNTCSSLGFHL
jgi:hypothetical protein